LVLIVKMKHHSFNKNTVKIVTPEEHKYLHTGKRKQKKETLWQKVKWKCFMIKVKFWLWQSDLKHKLNRINHCNKGYHKISLKNEALTKYSCDNKKRAFRTDFYECSECGLLLFASEKDKKNYQRIHKHEAISFRKMMEFMKYAKDKDKNIKINK